MTQQAIAQAVATFRANGGAVTQCPTRWAPGAYHGDRMRLSLKRRFFDIFRPGYF